MTTPQILIVDDDADTRNLVKGVVEVLGYQTVLAENGERAIAICREMMPDLVVLDLMMPGMSGIEVCSWIKSTELGQMTPVLILTAINQLEDKLSVLDGGADEYLTKPFHFKELQTQINVLLRIRALNLKLQERNVELHAAQEKLVEQERKLLAHQLGGTAAHALGQPLTAIKLNLHLLETLPGEDVRSKKALAAIKQDIERMTALLQELREVDPTKREQYFRGTEILEMGEKKS